MLLWKAPDALRLEILSPFGSPVFAVVAKGARLRALSIARGRYYVGRTDRESMARWLGLPVSSAMMLRILQGRVPVLNGEGLDDARLGWNSEMGALRLEIPLEIGRIRRQVAFLDLKTLEPRRVRFGEQGAALDVRYGPFRRIGEGRVPEWVVIEDLGRGHRVRFQMLKGDKRPA
ncbi:MAG: hypothetical protein V3U53_01720, partial [bacterium]